MSDFEALYLAIKSDQLSARQVVEAMQDEAFAAFYKQRKLRENIICRS